MAMYKIILTIENPMSGIRKAMTFQFDPDTLDEPKWASAFPAVEAQLADVVAQSAMPDKEPPVW